MKHTEGKKQTFSYMYGKVVGTIISVLLGAALVLILIWIVMSLGTAIIAPFV